MMLADIYDLFTRASTADLKEAKAPLEQVRRPS
jgi:hypothetical protein